MNELILKIKELKKEKNAVILTHCYQNSEIDEVSDFVGDSLFLSRQAKNTNSDVIVFAGVYFMAQTAKLLSPEKKVLLPVKEAGCEMADMIDVEKLRKFKSKYPDILTICYINSTAEVKAECDICCTSSNALKVIKNSGAKKVLFLPDENLGKWVGTQLKDVEVITYSGCCPIHANIKKEDVLTVKQKYNNAKILVHPECKEDVVNMADFVGSTSGIMDYVKTSQDKSFIIVTEKGVLDRLKRDYPQKEFVLCKDNIICPSMKLTTLKDIYNALKYNQYEINVDENISKKAVKCIDKMLDLCK